MIRVYFVTLLFLSFSCATTPAEYALIQGNTMGTTYTIKVDLPSNTELTQKIDQVLYEVNDAASTYIDTSLISLFNKDYAAYTIENTSNSKSREFIKYNFELAKEISEASGGAFDPTVMPLVNYWGFGYDEREIQSIDTTRVLEIQQFIGINKIKLKDGALSKEGEQIQLDFSSIAKGFAVDKVSEALVEMGSKNHFVEIGGEVYAKGVNEKGQIWRTGISVPSPGSGFMDFQEVVEVVNSGIATSGNYRNFYELDGKIISHTINPVTGFPERNELLSATIIAPNCTYADGYATACMVLGVTKCKEMIEKEESIE